jgi:hypothetical protein
MIPIAGIPWQYTANTIAGSVRDRAPVYGQILLSLHNLRCVGGTCTMPAV